MAAKLDGVTAHLAGDSQTVCSVCTLYDIADMLYGCHERGQFWRCEVCDTGHRAGWENEYICESDSRFEAMHNFLEPKMTGNRCAYVLERWA